MLVADMAKQMDEWMDGHAKEFWPENQGGLPERLRHLSWMMKPSTQLEIKAGPTLSKVPSIILGTKQVP